jgi:hypothetical protein
MAPMPLPKLEINAHSIVLIGSFNPGIFHPQWFARQNLLPDGEAESSNLQVVHPQASQFETERFAIQVTLDRFQAMTKPNTPGDVLRDLVLGTFSILEHTPVNALGMNRQMHFSMGSEEAWHRLGDKLAPKDIWKQVLPNRPGMRTLDILSGSTDPQLPSITVRVQPSLMIVHGAYFEINNHHPAQRDGKTNDSAKGDSVIASRAQDLLKILKEQWEPSQREGENIARKVLDWSAE